jgi:hypothetical protein
VFKHFVKLYFKMIDEFRSDSSLIVINTDLFHWFRLKCSGESIFETARLQAEVEALPKKSPHAGAKIGDVNEFMLIKKRAHRCYSSLFIKPSN